MWNRIVAAVAVAALASGCGSKEESQSGGVAKVLRFSAIPDQNNTELKEKFDRVAAYLATKLGVKVEYRPARDYQASVEAFKNGDIHLAWFGGLTGVQARRAVKGARAIAQGEEDPAFTSYFIAHKDTGLTRSEEFPTAIAGLKFTFGAQDSTSGRLMPEHFLRLATGKAPQEFFSTPPAFSQNHDQTAELVQAGRFQAGVLSYAVYDRRVKEGKTDPDVCRIIWKTPPYPDYNFTAHPSLDRDFGAGFMDRLQKALLEMTDPGLLAAFPRKRLIPASNEDFDPIAKVAAGLGFLRE
ncbi:MAG: putative selenate ABC transporter substrate-binding protein [Planctomycetaceae bacterium]